MKPRHFFIAFAIFAALVCLAATTTVRPGLKISQYPNNGFIASNALFITEKGDGSTNENISFGQLALRTTNGINTAIQSLASTTYVNTVSSTVSNSVVTFVLVTSNNIVGSGFARLEVQTNGVRVGLVTNLNFASGVTGLLSGTTAVLGASGGSGSLSGSTNFMNLSVQAAKLPVTNYPAIDAGWTDWELIYYRTNAEGSTASLVSYFQFVVPPDYATNSMKVRVLSTLVSTNGPNSSNTIFGVAFLKATPGDSTDLHTASFGSDSFGTNTWAASPTGTNKVQSVTITTTTASLLQKGDLAIIAVKRDTANDTVGGATSVVGLQLEYTRQ